MRGIILPGVVISLGGTAAGQQATFTSLPFLPQGVSFAQVYGISADGQAVVGSSLLTGGIAAVAGAAVWRSGAIEFAYNPAGCSATAAAIIQAGGAGGTIVGWADYGPFSPLGVQAFLTRDGLSTLLGDFSTNQTGAPRSYGKAISADGSWVVGNGTSGNGTEAFRYDVLTGTFHGLGALLPPGPSFASWGSGISADGSVVVGSSYSAPQQLQGFRWTAAAGMVAIPFLPGAQGQAAYAYAEAISANGNAIVGESRSILSGNGVEAYRWTAAGIQPLGDLPGGSFQSFAYCVNADGSVVAGRATIEGPGGPFGGGSQGRAFIWDAQDGIRDLHEVLQAGGVNLAGWSLQEVRGISADGLTLAGIGTNPANQTQAWLATLPPPIPPVCYPNCDSSTTVPILNVLDFSCFLNKFAAGDPYANCDASIVPPVLNVLDFSCFLNKFAAGCR
jgi:uncharacterized membrane protein